MFAILFPIILIFSVLCDSREELLGPRNVRLTSFNMDLVLSWDPPENATKDLVYRAEYNSQVGSFRLGCPNTTTHSCDFTNPSISVYGTYTSRVRAELGAQHSAWVKSGDITMDEHTTIGQPSVLLIPSGVNMELSIKDPVFRISEFRKTYSYATYNITYWEKAQEDKTKRKSHVPQNRVVLNDLEPSTMYCVQVQINTDRNVKNSQPSDITCEKTTVEEQPPWVVAVVTIVVMATAVIVTALLVVYWKRMCYFFCPKDLLPQYIKEPPHSSIYAAMQNSQPPEEVYHPVRIMTQEGAEAKEELPLQAGATNCNAEFDSNTQEQLNENSVMILQEGDEVQVKTGERTVEMDGGCQEPLFSPI